MRKFYFISFALLAYTVYKLTRFFPDNTVFAAALIVPLYFLTLGWQYAYRFRPQAFEKSWYKVLAWTGSTIMGVWATFVLLSLPFDLIQLATYSIDLDFSLALLNQNMPVTLLLFSGLAAAIGYLQVATGPTVKSVDVPIQGLPDQLDGLKLIQISDLHVGSTVRQAYVQTVVQKVNQTNADFVFLTGDIADARFDSIESYLDPVGQMLSRHGSYYVLGNHEYYWGADRFVEKMQRLGIQVLKNQSALVTLSESNILVSGLTDPAAERFAPEERPDLQKCELNSESPSVDFKILLSHRPDFYSEAESRGYHLQLSGHTHAGQFFPFSLLIPLVHKFYRGLYRFGHLWLYVNPGTGYWGPANRLGIAPEITLLTLKKL